MCRIHWVLVWIGLIFVVGCGEIVFDAELEVFEELSLSKKEGRPRTLAPGKFSGKLELVSEKIKLTLEENGEIFIFRIPKMKIPQKNGSFFVSAEDSGQAYDLVGWVRRNRWERRTGSFYKQCVRKDLLTGTRSRSFRQIDHYLSGFESNYKIEIYKPSDKAMSGLLTFEKEVQWTHKTPTCDSLGMY